MLNKIILATALFAFANCDSKNELQVLSTNEKNAIRKNIQHSLDKTIEATRIKDIDLYMSQLPADFIIYEESGEKTTREKQKEYVLRDWKIIDTTLSIMVQIDSIQFFKMDSVIVYTFQEWERMMFQRDGLTTDTILTTQRHFETWKKTRAGWFGYDIQELGGQVFINGKVYN